MRGYRYHLHCQGFRTSSKTLYLAFNSSSDRVRVYLIVSAVFFWTDNIWKITSKFSKISFLSTNISNCHRPTLKAVRNFKEETSNTVFSGLFSCRCGTVTVEMPYNCASAYFGEIRMNIKTRMRLTNITPASYHHTAIPHYFRIRSFLEIF